MAGVSRRSRAEPFLAIVNYVLCWTGTLSKPRCQIGLYGIIWGSLTLN